MKMKGRPEEHTINTDKRAPVKPPVKTSSAPKGKAPAQGAKAPTKEPEAKDPGEK